MQADSTNVRATDLLAYAPAHKMILASVLPALGCFLSRLKEVGTLSSVTNRSAQNMRSVFQVHARVGWTNLKAVVSAVTWLQDHAWRKPSSRFYTFPVFIVAILIS
jgi:hypothetical protein